MFLFLNLISIFKPQAIDHYDISLTARSLGLLHLKLKQDSFSSLETPVIVKHASFENAYISYEKKSKIGSISLSINRLLIVLSPKAEEFIPNEKRHILCQNTKTFFLSLASLAGIDKISLSTTSAYNSLQNIISRWIKKIIHYLIVTLLNFLGYVDMRADEVNIIYEDASSISSSPFRICLSFSFESQMKIQKMKIRSLFQKNGVIWNARIYKLCTYFDEEKQDTFPLGYTRKNLKTFEFFLQPTLVSIKFFLDLGSYMDPSRVQLEILVDEINILISRKQYLDSIRASYIYINYWRKHYRSEYIRDIKNSSPRDLWIHAIDYVIQAIKEKQRINVQLKRGLTYRNEYIDLYRKKVYFGTSIDKEHIARLEEKLDYNQIVHFRKISNLSLLTDIYKDINYKFKSIRWKLKLTNLIILILLLISFKICISSYYRIGATIIILLILDYSLFKNLILSRIKLHNPENYLDYALEYLVKSSNPTLNVHIPKLKVEYTLNIKHFNLSLTSDYNIIAALNLTGLYQRFSIGNIASLITASIESINISDNITIPSKKLDIIYSINTNAPKSSDIAILSGQETDSSNFVNVSIHIKTQDPSVNDIFISSFNRPLNVYISKKFISKMLQFFASESKDALKSCLPFPNFENKFHIRDMSQVTSSTQMNIKLDILVTAPTIIIAKNYDSFINVPVVIGNIGVIKISSLPLVKSHTAKCNTSHSYSILLSNSYVSLDEYNFSYRYMNLGLENGYSKQENNNNSLATSQCFICEKFQTKAKLYMNHSSIDSTSTVQIEVAVPILHFFISSSRISSTKDIVFEQFPNLNLSVTTKPKIENIGSCDTYNYLDSMMNIFRVNPCKKSKPSYSSLQIPYTKCLKYKLKKKKAKSFISTEICLDNAILGIYIDKIDRLSSDPIITAKFSFTKFGFKNVMDKVKFNGSIRSIMIQEYYNSSIKTKLDIPVFTDRLGKDIISCYGSDSAILFSSNEITRQSICLKNICRNADVIVGKVVISLNELYQEYIMSILVDILLVILNSRKKESQDITIIKEEQNRAKSYILSGNFKESPDDKSIQNIKGLFKSSDLELEKDSSKTNFQPPTNYISTNETGEILDGKFSNRSRKRKNIQTINLHFSIDTISLIISTPQNIVFELIASNSRLITYVRSDSALFLRGKISRILCNATTLCLYVDVPKPKHMVCFSDQNMKFALATSISVTDCPHFDTSIRADFDLLNITYYNYYTTCFISYISSIRSTMDRLVAAFNTNLHFSETDLVPQKQSLFGSTLYPTKSSEDLLDSFEKQMPHIIKYKVFCKHLEMAIPISRESPVSNSVLVTLSTIKLDSQIIENEVAILCDKFKIDINNLKLDLSLPDSNENFEVLKYQNLDIEFLRLISGDLIRKYPYIDVVADFDFLAIQLAPQHFGFITSIFYGNVYDLEVKNTDEDEMNENKSISTTSLKVESVKSEIISKKNLIDLPYLVFRLNITYIFLTILDQDFITAILAVELKDQEILYAKNDIASGFSYKSEECKIFLHSNNTNFNCILSKIDRNRPISLRCINNYVERKNTCNIYMSYADIYLLPKASRSWISHFKIIWDFMIRGRDEFFSTPVGKFLSKYPNYMQYILDVASTKVCLILETQNPIFECFTFHLSEKFSANYRMRSEKSYLEIVLTDSSLSRDILDTNTLVLTRQNSILTPTNIKIDYKVIGDQCYSECKIVTLGIIWSYKEFSLVKSICVDFFTASDSNEKIELLDQISSMRTLTSEMPDSYSLLKQMQVTEGINIPILEIRLDINSINIDIVEYCDTHETIPVILLQIDKLSGNFKKDQYLSAQLEIAHLRSYSYNLELNGLEPFIEDWSISGVFSQTNECNKFDIASDQLINMNFNKSIVDGLLQVYDMFSSNRQEPKKKEPLKLILRNTTGYSIKVDTIFNGLIGDSVLIEYGEEKNINFNGSCLMKTMHQNMKHYLRVLLQGQPSPCNIEVHRGEKHLIPTVFNKIDSILVTEVSSCKDYHLLVTFRGTYKVVNNNNFDVEILILGDTECVQLLKSKSTYCSQIDVASHRMIRIRPKGSIEWSEMVNLHQTRAVRIFLLLEWESFDGITKKNKIFSCAKISSDLEGLDCTLKMDPPISLANYLTVPMNARFVDLKQFQESDDRNLLIKPTESVQFHELPLFDKKLGLSIRIPKYDWSEPIPIFKLFAKKSGLKENDFMLTKSLTLKDEKGLSLTLVADIDITPTNSHIIKIFATYWIVNNTGLNLFYKSSLEREELISGQGNTPGIETRKATNSTYVLKNSTLTLGSKLNHSDQKKWYNSLPKLDVYQNMSKNTDSRSDHNSEKDTIVDSSETSDSSYRCEDIEASNYSYLYYGGHKLSISLENSTWSDSFNLGLGDKGAIFINDVASGRQYCFSMFVLPAPSPFWRTSIVRISPYFILINKTMQTLICRQECETVDSPYALRLLPGEVIPYHWPYYSWDKLLVINNAKHLNLSTSPLSLEIFGRFPLRFYRCIEDLSCLTRKVEEDEELFLGLYISSLQYNSVFVRFEMETHYNFYTIINQTDQDILAIELYDNNKTSSNLKDKELEIFNKGINDKEKKKEKYKTPSKKEYTMQLNSDKKKLEEIAVKATRYSTNPDGEVVFTSLTLSQIMTEARIPMRVKSYSKVPFLFSWPQNSKHKIFICVASDDANKWHKVNFDKIEFRNSIKFNKNWLHIKASVDGHTKQLNITTSKEEMAEEEPNAEVNKSVFQLQFSEFGVSINDEKPQELMYIMANNIGLNITQSAILQTFELHIGNIQVDNSMYSTPCPVVLHSLDQPDESSFFHASVTRDMRESFRQCFRYISVKLQKIALNLDYGFLYNSLSWAASVMELMNSRFINVLVEDVITGEGEGRIPCPTSEVMKEGYYFDIFHLNPLQIRIWFTTTPNRDVKKSYDNISELMEKYRTYLVTINGAPLILPGLLLVNVFTTMEDLYNRLFSHYSNSVMKQFLLLIGSSDVLGNPVSLLENLGTGFMEFVHEPAEGFVQNPARFGIGIAKGTSSLLKSCLDGVINTAEKLVGNIGLIGETVSMDKTYQHQRVVQKMRRANSIGTGIRFGVKEFGFGLSQGVSGIWNQPAYGAREDGIKGFTLGVGKGLIGLVVKPTVGIVDLVVRTTEGVRSASDASQIERVRKPRNFSSDLFIKHYDSIQAEGQFLLKTLSPRKYKSEYYTCHTVLSRKRIILVSNIHVFYLKIKRLKRLDFLSPWKVRWKLRLLNLSDHVNLDVNNKRIELNLKSNEKRRFASENDDSENMEDTDPYSDYLDGYCVDKEKLSMHMGEKKTEVHGSSKSKTYYIRYEKLQDAIFLVEHLCQSIMDATITMPRLKELSEMRNVQNAHDHNIYTTYGITPKNPLQRISTSEFLENSKNPTSSSKSTVRDKKMPSQNSRKSNIHQASEFESSNPLQIESSSAGAVKEKSQPSLSEVVIHGEHDHLSETRPVTHRKNISRWKRMFGSQRVKKKRNLDVDPKDKKKELPRQGDEEAK